MRHAPIFVSSGIAFDLDAPALIVGQMQMKHVELVLPHLVEDQFDIRDREEMARRIQHQPSPFEARKVFDVHATWQPLATGQQLRRRHGAIVETRRGASFDPHAV